MKEYGKWLIIGLLIGAGISIGWKSTDYYIDTVIFEKGKGPSTAEIKNPKEINILEYQLVKTPLTFQVMAIIENKSDLTYSGILLKAKLSDSSGIIDRCEGVERIIKPGKNEAILNCNVSHNSYPKAYITDIKITEAYIDKTT